MSKLFQRAEKALAEKVEEVLRKYHPELETLGIKFDLLNVIDPDGDENMPALFLHGVPCLAFIKIVGKRERSKGNGDVEIQFDQRRVSKLSDKRLVALIDHELEHLEIQKDKHGVPKNDDLGRPRLGTKPHDWDFGWFNSIARRHGEDSGEAIQARRLCAETGQLYFPFGSIEGGAFEIRKGKPKVA